MRAPGTPAVATSRQRCKCLPGTHVYLIAAVLTISISGHTDERTQTDELEHRFRNIIGKSPSMFIEKLYRMYEMRLLEDANDLSMLEDAISQLEGLSTSVTQYGDEMLQNEGYSIEYTRLDNIGREVRQVIRMLQEVLCEGLTEPLGLLIAHRNRSLSYQRA